MANAARQRTENARALDDNLKLHQQLLTLDGREHRIVTLRPGTVARFSTNFFHETWHVISDRQGAQTLARLLWGLAHCKLPRTLIVLYGEHLSPTPFDGEPSDPIVFASVPGTPVNAQQLADLKRRMPRLAQVSRDAHTIRWQTFGLDQALDDPKAFDAQAEQRRLSYKGCDDVWSQERMGRLGGCLCYGAPPAVLCSQAVQIARLTVARDSSGLREMDYHFLAHNRRCWWGADGEVQIFTDYWERVSESAQARREFFARSGGATSEAVLPADPDAARQTIQQRSLAKKQARDQRRSRQEPDQP